MYIFISYLEQVIFTGTYFRCHSQAVSIYRFRNLPLKILVYLKKLQLDLSLPRKNYIDSLLVLRS